ncbi:hypothetical protein FKK78_11790, partial [Enterobacter hormaechei]|uniref:hypothetical protein n=1 Tax=Enterobacter hormaechei TaxID=158836 RepID=UPI001D57D699
KHMITGGDLRQSRLDVGYKTFTISPWGAWRVALSNYEDVPSRPDTLLLRPFEAIWWVQE